MEVKDVNNSVNPLLFNKGAALASAAQALGTGFASLLGQTSMAMDVLPASSAVEAKPEVKAAADNKQEVVRPERENAPAAANDKDKTVSSDNEKTAQASSGKKVKEEKSSETSQPKPTVKKAKEAASQEAAVVPQEPVQTTAAAAEVAAAPVEGTVVADVQVSEETAFVDVVSGQEAVEQAQDSAPAAAEAAFAEQGAPMLDEVFPNAEVTAVFDGKEVKLSDFALGEDQIAAADAVMVFDENTGKTVTMSGAEFLQKAKELTTASASLEKDAAAAVSVSASDSVTEQVAEVSPAMAVPQAESKTEKPESRFNAAAQTQSAKPASAESGQVNADEARAAQAAVIDSKLVDGQKVKVEVQVKEEKFSYTASSDLVKDELSLREVLLAAKQEAEGESETVKSPLLNTNVSSTAMPKAQPAAPVADAVKAAQMNAVQAVNVSAAAEAADGSVAAGSGVSSVTGLNSTVLSHGAAGGSEFVNSAKAEANAKTADASFRDIYKGMSKEVIDQVKVNITKSAVKGVDKIDITLKPEDLGHIEVKMHISKDGKLQAHIISSRPETMEVLQKEIQSLEKAFNDAGFQTDEGSLSFSFRDDGQAGQERNSELRDFIGNVFANEANEEFAGNDNIAEWSPASGLNIRV